MVRLDFHVSMSFPQMACSGPGSAEKFFLEAEVQICRR